MQRLKLTGKRGLSIADINSARDDREEREITCVNDETALELRSRGQWISRVL